MPTASSHHESDCAARVASPIALVIAPGMPPLSAASSVPAASAKASETAAHDQRERQ